MSGGVFRQHRIPVMQRRLKPGINFVIAPLKQERRNIEKLYAETMGRPMSSRTWCRVRKALRRDWIKGSGSYAARFFSTLRKAGGE